MDTNHPIYDDFFNAVYLSKIDELSQILEDYPYLDVNHTDRYHNSALIIAAGINCPEIVKKLLLTQKVNVHHVNAYGQTALTTAIKHNTNIDIIKVLLHFGANVNHPTKHQSALAKALFFNNNPEVIQALLNANPLLDGINTAGESALIIAAKHSTLEVVRLLLSQPRLDPNYMTPNRRTALMQLAMVDSPQAIYALLAHHRFNPEVLNQRETALKSSISLQNSGNIGVLLDSMTEQEIDDFKRSYCLFNIFRKSQEYFLRMLDIYKMELKQGNRPWAANLRENMLVSTQTPDLTHPLIHQNPIQQEGPATREEATPNSTNFEYFSPGDFTAKEEEPNQNLPTPPTPPLTFRFSELSITAETSEMKRSNNEPRNYLPVSARAEREEPLPSTRRSPGLIGPPPGFTRRPPGFYK